MTKFYFLILTSFIISCNGSKSYFTNKWVHTFDRGVADSLILFDDTNYRFYDAELEGFFIGKYIVKDDSLFLMESDTTEGSINERMYTFQLEINKLKPIKLEEKRNNRWINTNFRFDSSYVMLPSQN